VDVEFRRVAADVEIVMWKKLAPFELWQKREEL